MTANEIRQLTALRARREAVERDTNEIIARLRAKNVTTRAIADKLGVSNATVSRRARI